MTTATTPSNGKPNTTGASVIDAAAQASIGAAARELHLPTVRAEAARLAEIAHRERRTHLGYLAEVLAAEVDDRTERRRARRINDAKFPRQKRLADFNVDAVPTIQAAPLGQLAAGHYMDAGEPVVLLGDSGTGKSHLLIGLGLAACEQGRRVRYVTTAQLVNELVEAADERVLSRVVGRYGRLDLLLLDELGYVQIDPRGAELLFQIITEREERASIAIATNLPFSEWGTVFPDPRLVAAIVDRVTFNAHILETGTQSYRLRTSKTTARRKSARANRPRPRRAAPRSISIAVRWRRRSQPGRHGRGSRWISLLTTKTMITMAATPPTAMPTTWLNRRKISPTTSNANAMPNSQRVRADSSSNRNGLRREAGAFRLSISRSTRADRGSAAMPGSFAATSMTTIVGRPSATSRLTSKLPARPARADATCGPGLRGTVSVFDPRSVPASWPSTMTWNVEARPTDVLAR